MEIMVFNAIVNEPGTIPLPSFPGSAWERDVFEAPPRPQAAKPREKPSSSLSLDPFHRAGGGFVLSSFPGSAWERDVFEAPPRPQAAKPREKPSSSLSLDPFHRAGGGFVLSSFPGSAWERDVFEAPPRPQVAKPRGCYEPLPSGSGPKLEPALFFLLGFLACFRPGLLHWPEQQPLHCEGIFRACNSDKSMRAKRMADSRS